MSTTTVRTGWRRLLPTLPRAEIVGLMYAGIWLVFLMIPVTATYYSDAPVAWQAVSYTAIGIFAVVYLWLAAWWFGDEGQSSPTVFQLVLAAAVLASLAALSAVAIDAWAVAFTPFIAALVVFTTSPQTGIPVGVLIWLVPSVTVYLLSGALDIWIVAGPGIGVVFIIIIRVTEHFDEQNRRAKEQLRAAEERDRIAGDVHDVLGHTLTVLSIKAQLAHRLMDSDPDRARAELDHIEQLSRESLGQVRSTVTRLKSPQLPAELDVACAALETAGIRPILRVEQPEQAGQTGGPPLLAWALREAVTNVVRHSSASRCEIEIGPGWLKVSDDGTGLDGAREGNGLWGLRERAKKDGAEVLIGAAYPQMPGTLPERPGTQIEVRL